MAETEQQHSKPQIHFVVVSDAGDGARFSFPADCPRIRIGRALENDIVLTDDRVSRLHASVVSTESGWQIEDVGSRTGLAINGAVISSGLQGLQPSDLIHLGSTLLRFDSDQQLEPPIDLTPSPTDEVSAVLLVSTLGAGEPESYQLACGPVTVGKDSDCDVVLSGDQVSRYHARIDLADQWTVTDLGSAAGTLLNGAPLRAPESVKFGDIIRIGSFSLQLTHPAAAQAPSADQTGEGQRVDFEQTVISSRTQITRDAEAEFALMCLAGPSRGIRFPLNSSGHTVGSGTNCKPRIEGLAEVAFMLMREDGDGYRVQQLPGSAAIRVSGGRKLPCTVKPGDLLDVNGNVFRLVRRGGAFSARFDSQEFDRPQQKRKPLPWVAIGVGLAALLGVIMVLLA